MKTRSSGRGFTIVELTIATTIFATVLLVGLASFLGVSRVYYKGLSITQTQAIAQQVLTQLSGDIQFAPTVVTNTPNTGFPTGSGSSQFICLGNVRYTYNLYKEVSLADHDNQAKFGLLRDILSGTTGCNSPFGTGGTPLNNPVELLGNKMRLSKFDVTAAKNQSGNPVTNLWDMGVTVAFGDDDALQNPDNSNVTCNANLKATQFCSVSTQNTTVSRGL